MRVCAVDVSEQVSIKASTLIAMSGETRVVCEATDDRGDQVSRQHQPGRDCMLGGLEQVNYC